MVRTDTATVGRAAPRGRRESEREESRPEERVCASIQSFERPLKTGGQLAIACAQCVGPNQDQNIAMGRSPRASTNGLTDASSHQIAYNRGSRTFGHGNAQSARLAGAMTGRNAQTAAPQRRSAPNGRKITSSA